jgi:hypothetical protein
MDMFVRSSTLSDIEDDGDGSEKYGSKSLKENV